MWQGSEIADQSDAWLRSLKDATACLLRYGRPPTMEELNSGMIYLDKLEATLRSKRYQWGRPPHEIPPTYESSIAGDRSEERTTTSGGRRNRNRENRQSSRRTAAESTGTPPNYGATSNGTAANGNRFATFLDDSDDQSLSSNSADDEAGDRPEVDAEEKDDLQQDIPYTEGMDKRRLMIRILNGQSEVYAARAMMFRKQSPPAWFSGADQCAHCLHKIHAALILADSTISQWMSSDVVNDRTMKLLTDDANIVEVAVQSMTENREVFLSAARQQEAYLTQKLQPHWQSRDEVRDKLGDRWYNNPSPKNVHYRLRANDEKQLQDIRKALECLEKLDTAAVVESSKRLKAMLLGQVHTSSHSPRNKRYNGQRPRDLSNRVDSILYPGPTEFGWEFTGSWGVCEFFEKDGIKLDWYFTTATIKTSMDHPTQGKTQLFGSHVDPNMYRLILENPRVHTSKRYHRK